MSASTVGFAQGALSEALRTAASGDLVERLRLGVTAQGAEEQADTIAGKGTIRAATRRQDKLIIRNPLAAPR